jgi:hypothetical protein
MSDIKHSLARIDSEITLDLIRITQCALSHPETLSRMAQETGLSEDHLSVLKQVSSELMDGNDATPTITTVDQLNSASNDLARSKAGF